MSYIELKNIEKSYGKKIVLKNFNLSVERGEFVGIQGESGKGKSTLLNIIGLFEPCEGEIWLNGHRVSSKDYRKLSKTFNIKIGYLFQNFALIDDVSVYENLNIVQSLGNKSEKRQKIIEALRRVGFEEEVLKQKIYELSGGEQQRIAVARIMLYDSDIILADEPTGSLDRKNKEIVMRLLKKLQKENKTILMVSHDDESLEYCSRVVCL